jgi:transcriptional regulator with XRE-family HTH domain
VNSGRRKAPALLAKYPNGYIIAWMNPVRHLRETLGLTQQELASAAGTSQSTIAAYESGRKSPTWRTIERLARAAGCTMDVRVLPALTREDRRSLTLHHAIAARLQADPDAGVALARRSLARMRAQHPGARALLDEWALLLRRPLSALLPVLSDPSPWARELRHVTPFAGLLSARERTAVYKAFAESERTSLALEPAS